MPISRGRYLEILAEYDSQKQVYESFGQCIERLVNGFIEEAGFSVHAVTSRVKDRDSLSRKLDRPASQYLDLSEITDIVGVRITTYFEDDVVRVAEVIQDEFAIDYENSVDKRELLDPDRFGYLSLHYIASLSFEREHLAEYRRFGGLKIEIQIRSILQHAWAEIEHDLGYKTYLSVPQPTRRRFSRLAGLLELADQEFMGIRNELREYQQTLEERIRNEPHQVEINKDSLQCFLSDNPFVHDVERNIAGATGVIRKPTQITVEAQIAWLKALNISTIGDLEDTFITFHSKVQRFAKNWLGDAGNFHMEAGFSLLYLVLFLIGESADEDLMKEYLREILSVEGDESESLVARIKSSHEASRTVG